jgi:hypothetical protein
MLNRVPLLRVSVDAVDSTSYGHCFLMRNGSCCFGLMECMKFLKV